MKFNSYKDEGIVLKRFNFGEADRILTVFTRRRGKLSLLAKGIRRTSSRKRGSLEVFSHIKFSGSTGKSIDIITEVEIIDSFASLRKDLKKVAVAFYLMEVIDRLTREDESHSELFDLCVISMKEIQSKNNLRKIKEEFVKLALVNLGFLSEESDISDVDAFLERIIERKINSARVGKRLLSDL